jgi:hypothetical protein
MSCIRQPITYTLAQINEPPLPTVGWDLSAKMHSAAPPSVYKPDPTLTLSLTPTPPPPRASLSPSAPPTRAGPIQGGCAALPAATGSLPAAPPPPPNRRAPLTSYPNHLSLSSGRRTTTGGEPTTKQLPAPRRPRHSPPSDPAGEQRLHLVVPAGLLVIDTST